MSEPQQTDETTQPEATFAEQKQEVVERLQTAELALRQSFEAMWWAVTRAHAAGDQLTASVLDARLAEMKRTAQLIGVSVNDVRAQIAEPKDPAQPELPLGDQPS